VATTASGKTRVPAVDGWFTTGDEPALLASRCKECGTSVFPPGPTWCPNPVCSSTAFAEVRLSRHGRVWSYTDARYQPPPPFRAPEPYEPFAIAAVELVAEQLVVIGQVVGDITCDDLAVGDEVELVVDTLFEDDDHAYVVWKWKPVATGGEGGEGEARADG
jgi:uncharacterized OB-fold protein